MSPSRPPRSLAGLLLAAAVGLATAAVAGGDGLPSPLRTFDADYRVTRSGLRLGTTQMRLEPHERGWRYSSRTEAEGLLALVFDGASTEETILEHGGAGLRPLRYRHTEPDPEDHIAVDFDWAAGTARVETADGGHTLGLEPGMRDPFSAVLAVMREVAAGRERISLPGIDNDGERTELRFAVRARERIEVPLGTFETVRVHRIRDDDRATVVWLAPELDWLPVRLEQRHEGDLVARAEIERLGDRRAAPRPSSGRQRRGR